MNIRNIGIFAHVDAGKTTLSEQLLMHSGAIRRAGSVDEGTAHTDNLPVEQRRGISVKATCVSLEWRGTLINLIDTPGHVDFSAEVERSLWALDAAVVVVCAVEGVQPHTETLFHALKEQSIPTLFFLNKTDREGADVPRVLAQMQRLLTPNAVLMADDDGVTEFVCAQDDDLLERYLSGEEFAPDYIRACLAGMTRMADACPVYSGSALRDEGVIPLLQVRYAKALNELQLHVMGTIQLEIIQELLDTRFGMKVTFSKPAVIYKETIAKAASGFVAYTMPKPCWAIMRFEIEPAPRGSGVTFKSTVPVRDILLRYQHQVEQALPLALHQGRLGWEVTDVNITLVDGNHHQFHTHPLDFIVATPWGIQDGLMRGGSTLLEPILETRFLLPPDCVGRVMSDVALMRGEVTHTETDEDRVLMTALIPVATSVDYASTLASATSGRGSMSVKLHGYRDCPLELGATAARRSVDPLDTSKYILAARSALEGGIFDLE